MIGIIDKLADLFVRFPGIGKRQSLRFVYFLLSQDKKYLDELSKAISNLKNEIDICKMCQRFFVGRETQKDLCSTCIDKSRDEKLLMVVEKDIDLENIEKSGSYKGYYFVLGATLPLLADEAKNNLRTTELKKRVAELKPDEVILATSANPEGENTARFVLDQLKNLQGKQKFKTSLLGRGLSTGTELEYSDADTIKNALANRA